MKLNAKELRAYDVPFERSAKIKYTTSLKIQNKIFTTQTLNRKAA